MDSVPSVGGVPIRLTDERWAHIVENRDDLADLLQELLGTVASPDAVVEARRGALQAIKGGIMGKTMVVVPGSESIRRLHHHCLAHEQT